MESEGWPLGDGCPYALADPLALVDPLVGGGGNYLPLRMGLINQAAG